MISGPKLSLDTGLIHYFLNPDFATLSFNSILSKRCRYKPIGSQSSPYKQILAPSLQNRGVILIVDENLEKCLND